MASLSDAHFASALSQNKETAAAAEAACDEALSELGDSVDLAVVFFSSHHGAAAEEIAGIVTERTGATCVLGCSAESVVGRGTEVEWEPAISVWLAKLPGVELQPMHLQFERTPEGGSIVGWPDDLPESWPDNAVLLLLGDPFSFPTDVLLERIHEDQPGIPVVGGMASAASQPGENRLLLHGQSLPDGAVAVLLTGDVQVATVVSQGCRPIGRHLVITQAERNVIHQLGGETAYDRLVEIYNTLSTSDQALVQKGLHVGRVVSEYQDQFEQGDFLIRNVMGVDQEQGAVAIADYVRPGQTVQFHVRDATTADGELRQLLAAKRDDDAFVPRAGLLFTCNGRGTRLFPEPHHDARAIQETLGDLPLAGFFAAGEIGPIGDRNFVHGFTASILLFG